MASEAAKAVAHEVIATVARGEIPNKLAIQQKHGYSYKSAKTLRAIKTKTYQREIQPVADQLTLARQRAIDLLPKAETKAKYRDLVDGIDKITKNHQLLTGGSTANVLVGVKKLSDDELQHLADASES